MTPSLHRHLPAAALAIAAALIWGTTFSASVLAADEPSGYRLEQGAELDGFRLPDDVRLVGSWVDSASGLVFDRFQQYAAPFGVLVDGGQLTVVRRGGSPVLVAGNHYPGLTVSRRPAIAPSQAVSIASAGSVLPDGAGEAAPIVLRTVELRFDPQSGVLFYLVQSVGPASRVFDQIDAQSGRVLESWDALDGVNPGSGRGVKGDTKNLSGLTSKVSGKWLLKAADGSVVTLDARNGYAYGGSASKPLSDAGYGNDNDWKAAYQRVGVDAQYYADLTLRFYQDRLGYDLLDAANNCLFDSIDMVVHYGRRYDNAFWNGLYLVFGDGDGTTTTGMSGGQDVVSHELSHAVTECRAPLDYKDESGALNEAFSDMMATAAEWDYEEPLSSNCRRAPGQTECADWWLGEDVIIGGSDFAFRNLATPGLEGQPSHYTDRYRTKKKDGGIDSGGVHINSGIANQAFYLMVSGGRNARCSGPADAKADCDVLVPAIGMAHAEQIMFRAWLALTSSATFCAARDATVAIAEQLYPGSAADRAAADMAWRAVGVSACSNAAGFDIHPQHGTALTAPGGSLEFPITVTRSASDSEPIHFSVSDPAPASASFSPEPSLAGPSESTTLTLDVPTGVPSGVYPLTITANDGTRIRHASVTLVVDGQAPVAAIERVDFQQRGTVTVGGSVPLAVAWSATDALSGVVDGAAQHSTGVGQWATFDQGPGGSTVFGADDGPHQFRATAIDGVGNSAVSDPVVLSQSSAQEDAAQYSGSWRSFGTGNAWGTSRYGKARGATARFSFTGTAVAWVGQMGPKRGKAKVYLDGILTKVDLLAGTLQQRRIVFSASGLTAGAHTLKIVVKGTAGRPRVDVDGFVVLGP